MTANTFISMATTRASYVLLPAFDTDGVYNVFLICYRTNPVQFSMNVHFHYLWCLHMSTKNDIHVHYKRKLVANCLATCCT